MKKVTENTEKHKRLYSKELTLQDKLILLRERYKREGKDLAVLLGVTRVTFSRWTNGHNAIGPGKLRDKLLQLAGGFIDESDLPTHSAGGGKRLTESALTPTPKAAPKRTPAPKRKPAQDDELFI